MRPFLDGINLVTRELDMVLNEIEGRGKVKEAVIVIGLGGDGRSSRV